MSKAGSTYGSLSDDALDICSTSTRNRGVWYSVTPSFTRNITVSTLVASFHHEIVVFSGDTCEEATCDGIQEATYSNKASVTFVAEAGTKYFILVTGYNGIYDAFDQVGTFTLKIRGDGRPPTRAPSSSPTIAPMENTIGTPTLPPLLPPVFRPMKHMKKKGVMGHLKIVSQSKSSSVNGTKNVFSRGGNP